MFGSEPTTKTKDRLVSRWRAAVIDVPCKVGDSLRIGELGLVHVVSVEGNIVLLRVTAREQAWPEPGASPHGVDDEYEFRHSE